MVVYPSGFVVQDRRPVFCVSGAGLPPMNLESGLMVWPTRAMNHNFRMIAEGGWCRVGRGERRCRTDPARCGGDGPRSLVAADILLSALT